MFRWAVQSLAGEYMSMRRGGQSLAWKFLYGHLISVSGVKVREEGGKSSVSVARPRVYGRMVMDTNLLSMTTPSQMDCMTSFCSHDFMSSDESSLLFSGTLLWVFRALIIIHEQACRLACLLIMSSGIFSVGLVYGPHTWGLSESLKKKRKKNIDKKKK